MEPDVPWRSTFDKLPYCNQKSAVGGMSTYQTPNMATPYYQYFCVEESEVVVVTPASEVDAMFITSRVTVKEMATPNSAYFFFVLNG